MTIRASALIGAVVFGLAFQLAGCGGGGSSSGGGDAVDNTVASGSLTVTVTTTDDRAVDGSSGYFYVETHSPVTLTCNVACTISEQSNNGVTVSNAASQSNGWTATLDFADASSSLDLSVTTPDGSVLVRLRPIVGQSTATWSLDAHSWTRGSSTQNQNTSTAGATTAIAVNSTVLSNCKSSAYECSTVSVHWYGHTEGTFTIDPDFRTRQQYNPGTAWVNVKATGGTADDVIPNCTPLVSVPNEHYYNTDYRPTTGTIRVTRGSDGQFRVTTDVPLTVYKQPDSENLSLCIRSVAAPGAPATASVTLNAIY